MERYGQFVTTLPIDRIDNFQNARFFFEPYLPFNVDPHTLVTVMHADKQILVCVADPRCAFSSRLVLHSP
jgi:hypothetical protein